MDERTQETARFHHDCEFPDADGGLHAIKMVLFLCKHPSFFKYQGYVFANKMLFFSALLFLNLLCILLQFIPFKWRDTVRYQKIVKYIFIFINSLGIVVNMADVVYFEFGGRRTTSIIFSEFGSESNLGTILLNSLTNYWITWLFGVAMIITVILLYYNPIKSDRPRTAYPPNKIYYPIHTALFVLVTVLTIGGIRGGFGLKMHPIRQDSATIYCKKPLQAGIVLNTPFTLLSTMSMTGYKDPHFFPEETLDNLFNPIKNQIPKGGDMQRLNVVVFILESFSMEYFGFFNKDKDNGHYQGYTPFLDSLLEKSYSFQYSFANGIRSVDSMPATFAGIPRYIEPYCYYLYASNTLQGLPEMLRREGYITAFFHGAPNTTLGFKGFTNAIGFESYYGMDEYGNNQDFDGTWAIFDEPYLKYFAEKSNEIIRVLRDSHTEKQFLKEDGSLDLTPSPVFNTATLLELGLIQNGATQSIDDFSFFGQDYFCPKDNITGKINITANTFSIHHYDGSWLDEEMFYIRSVRLKLAKFLPGRVAHFLSYVFGFTKTRGILKMPEALINHKRQKK